MRPEGRQRRFGIVHNCIIVKLNMGVGAIGAYFQLRRVQNFILVQPGEEILNPSGEKKWIYRAGNMVIP